jgi:uncharacterized protein (TIGR02452 family)
MNTDELRALAASTTAIIEAGRYLAPSGREVRIAGSTAAAVAGTRLYLPGQDAAPPVETGGVAPVIEVTNQSSLSASRRLGKDAACLVFASARKPGGGFLNGAQAQEESIARVSALYACQTSVPQFYTIHREERDLRYTDRVIYSPRVPVFRDEDGTLLEEPYLVSFLTAAAPNLGAILTSQLAAAGSVPGVLAARARRVLEVAAAHGHRALVLGAWGCGVFGNDAATVARIFAEHLGQTAGWFDHVVFAVLDRQRGAPTYNAFAEVFGVKNGSPADPDLS